MSTIKRLCYHEGSLVGDFSGEPGVGETIKNAAFRACWEVLRKRADLHVETLLGELEMTIDVVDEFAVKHTVVVGVDFTKAMSWLNPREGQDDAKD